ncbi:hypothetical protein H6758_04820 [Candidatus Nomurabacteria bacterium]|nr:hypothetical protein [Candidatus Nomurabacteria bacterium]
MSEENEKRIYRVDAASARRRHSDSEARLESHQKESREKQAEQLVASWMRGPVVVVTTSEYRRRAMVDLGFEDENVLTVDLPIDEQTVLRGYIESFGGNFFYPHRTDGPMIVAEAKVTSALASSSKEHLIFAADTLPSTYQYEDGFKAHPMEKPGSIENAKQFARNTLMEIAKNYAIHVHRMRHLRQRWMEPDYQMTEDEALAASVLGSLPMQVHVHTGVAIRPPHDERVWVFDNIVKMFPTKVYEMVERVVPQVEQTEWLSDEEATRCINLLKESLNDLADCVIDLGGERTTKISGGINYAQKEIRDLLGIRYMMGEQITFGDESEMSEGVFLGMPTKESLKQALKVIATEIVAEREK